MPKKAKFANPEMAARYAAGLLPYTSLIESPVSGSAQRCGNYWSPLQGG